MSFKEFIIILILIITTLGPVSYFNNDSGQGQQFKKIWVKMHRNLLEIYEYLRRNEEEPLIVIENVFSPLQKRVKGYFNPFTAFTGHYALLSDDRRLLKYGLFENEIRKRRKDIKAFYASASIVEQERILKKYEIAYVIADRPMKIRNHLTEVKRSGPFVLYRVRRF